MSLSVDKYRSEEDKTLTRKIAKFSMHSLNKKSNRLGQKFISKLGISSPVILRPIIWIRKTRTVN